MRWEMHWLSVCAIINCTRGAPYTPLCQQLLILGGEVTLNLKCINPLDAIKIIFNEMKSVPVKNAFGVGGRWKISGAHLVWLWSIGVIRNDHSINVIEQFWSHRPYESIIMGKLYTQRLASETFLEGATRTCRRLRVCFSSRERISVWSCRAFLLLIPCSLWRIRTINFSQQEDQLSCLVVALLSIQPVNRL